MAIELKKSADKTVYFTANHMVLSNSSWKEIFFSFGNSKDYTNELHLKGCS